VAFSPDGRLLATGGDGTVRFWNPTSRQPVGPRYTGRFSDVNTIAFSPDGTLLATGTIDGTARLWHVPR
jgi:WD40 repeat protein